MIQTAAGGVSWWKPCYYTCNTYVSATYDTITTNKQHATPIKHATLGSYDSLSVCACVCSSSSSRSESCSLTSSTVLRGRCSIPSKSLSFTGGDKLEKHSRMLSMTDTVSREAMLEGVHSSSVDPSLLWSHRPVSLSLIDAILEKDE